MHAGDLLAEVIGARPGEVLACDSTTVNLFKLVAAALDARGDGALVTDRGNFPTDRYVLEGIAAARGLELRQFDGEPEAETLPCGPGDVVVLSHVGYRTGALADLPALQAAATERGATLIWDLSHSAGAVPVELAAAGAELAVGCTYKYLNAGPGAPAYLYVAEPLQAVLRSPIWGWFGQRDQFAMERGYDPEPSLRRFLAGTPPILALAAVEEGARLTAEAGIEALHAKAIALTARLIALHDAWLAPLGFGLATPRDPARRGSHVALTPSPGVADHPRARRARARGARLPRPRHRAARRRAARYPARRRLGCARSPARPRRVAASTSGSTRPRAASPSVRSGPWRARAAPAAPCAARATGRRRPRPSRRPSG